MIITTEILPDKQTYAKIRAPHDLNLEALCVFLATGFFLDSDTYYKDEVCLAPGATHHLDDEGYLLKSEPGYNWHYSPRNDGFSYFLEEYSELLQTIIKEQTEGQKVILPLSGGLDSRCQAAVLHELGKEVSSFSYSFKNGYPEHKIAKQIATSCGFDHKSFKIDQGYLWDSLDGLADITNCYSEFTHPRQMCVLDEMKAMEGIFSLGHWGDVLFDDAAPNNLPNEQILAYLYKKMVKPKGLELASQLWDFWGLSGSFKDYLMARIEAGLNKLDMDNASSKVRAYKTQQWAHRWTTTNISVYRKANKVSLPFYDDRMIKFINGVPEKYLANRRLQIAHLKTYPSLAKITWHAHRPFSLNDYHKNKLPFNLSHRIISKVQRTMMALSGSPFIQRNWELQFLGKENDNHLKSYLFNSRFNEFVPKNIVNHFYDKFIRKDAINYAHPISMLLTLSVWKQKYHGN